MPGLAALLAAELAAEAEASEPEGPVHLVALLHAVDATRGAILAALDKNPARASLLLEVAAEDAADAFPPESRESYGLTLVLGAITEAAGAQS
jgi:hypothetical protein